eukprot:1369441-Pleurochrysis_carterae.AAC.1
MVEPGLAILAKLRRKAALEQQQKLVEVRISRPKKCSSCMRELLTLVYGEPQRNLQLLAASTAGQPASPGCDFLAPVGRTFLLLKSASAGVGACKGVLELCHTALSPGAEVLHGRFASANPPRVAKRPRDLIGCVTASSPFAEPRGRRREIVRAHGLRVLIKEAAELRSLLDGDGERLSSSAISVLEACQAWRRLALSRAP